MADLVERSPVDIVCDLIPPVGRIFADIGCGAGELTFALADRGAVIHGLEPDPVQARKHRGQQVNRVTFHEAGAEANPLASGSIDAVVFCYSLHHVPVAAMDAGLAEAVRVLRRPDGVLLVIEPDMRGTWSQLLQPFHDETEVRRVALEALDRCAAPVFAQAEEYWYNNTARFEDFAAFFAEQTAITFRDVDPARIDTPEVRERFEAGRDGGGYVFGQPLRVRLYRCPKPADEISL